MKTSQSGHLNASTKRTLNLLSETLIKLLEKKALEKITIMDICRIAQVPRATFYNYFEDKYDLLRYSLKLINDEITSAIDPDISEAERIRYIITSLIDFAESKYIFLKKINSANYNSILFAEIKNYVYNYLIDHFDKTEKQGIEMNVKSSIAAEFYSNAIVYSAKTWIDHDMSIPRNEVIESIIALTIITKDDKRII